jgi:hypothetical protein
MAIQSSLALSGCSGLYRCLRRGGSHAPSGSTRRNDSPRRNGGARGPGTDGGARRSCGDDRAWRSCSDCSARGSRADGGARRYRGPHHCAIGRCNVQDGHSALRPPHA